MRAPVPFFGVPIVPWTTERTLAAIVERLEERRFTQHGVVNVAKLVGMRSDPELRRAVLSCDIINADGVGVVWGARFLGTEVPERVTGINLFQQLLGLAARRGWPVYFLGSQEAILARAVAAARDAEPKLHVAGSHHGYFWQEEEQVVELIRASKARLLFVGISTPMKELFLTRWRHRLGVDFAMGVGGSFDILAGKTKRAPLWIQRMGMEWLFRIIQEPRRMWRRYWVTNRAFARMLLAAKWSGWRNAGA